MTDYPVTVDHANSIASGTLIVATGTVKVNPDIPGYGPALPYHFVARIFPGEARYVDLYGSDGRIIHIPGRREADSLDLVAIFNAIELAVEASSAALA